MIYVIRHAPTKSNLSGVMVKNYNAQGILDFDPEPILKNLPVNVSTVYVSDTLRAKQTAKTLYPEAEVTIADCLNEFNCHGIGDKKFWEMGEDEFNEMVSGNFTRESMYKDILDMWNTLVCTMKFENNDIVCISHGLRTRALIHFLKLMKKDTVISKDDFNPYRLINSMDEQFCNLDILKIDEHGNFEILKSGVKTHGFADKVH